MAGIINYPIIKDMEVNPFYPEDGQWSYVYRDTNIAICEHQDWVSPPSMSNTNNNGNNNSGNSGGNNSGGTEGGNSGESGGNGDSSTDEKPSVSGHGPSVRDDFPWNSLPDIVSSYIVKDEIVIENENPNKDNLDDITYFDYGNLDDGRDKYIHQPNRSRALDAHTYTYNLSYTERLYNEIYEHFLQVAECHKVSQSTITEFSHSILDNRNTYILSRYDEDSTTLYSKYSHPYIKNDDLTYYTSNNVMLSYDGKIINSSYQFGNVTTYLSIDNNIFVQTNIDPGKENILNNTTISKYNDVHAFNVYNVSDSTYVGKMVIELPEHLVNKVVKKINECTLIYKNTIDKTYTCAKTKKSNPAFCQMSVYVDSIKNNKLNLSSKMSSAAYEYFRIGSIHNPYNYELTVKYEGYDSVEQSFVIKNFNFIVKSAQQPTFDILVKSIYSDNYYPLENLQSINSERILYVKMNTEEITEDADKFKIVSANIVSGTNSSFSIFPKIYFDDNFSEKRDEFQVICLGYGSYIIEIYYFNPTTGVVECYKQTINIVQGTKSLPKDKLSIEKYDGKIVIHYENCAPTGILPIFKNNKEVEYTLDIDYLNKTVSINYAEESITKFFYVDQSNVIRSYSLSNERALNDQSSVQVFTLDDDNEFANVNKDSYLFSIEKQRYLRPEMMIGLSVVKINENPSQAYSTKDVLEFNDRYNQPAPVDPKYNNVDKPTSSSIKKEKKRQKILNSATPESNIDHILVRDDVTNLQDALDKMPTFDPSQYGDQLTKISDNLNKGYFDSIAESEEADLTPWNTILNIYADNAELEWNFDSIVYDNLAVEENERQKRYKVSFNKIDKLVDDKRVTFKIYLSNKDYIWVYFDLISCEVVKDNDIKEILLIDDSSIRISGTIDGNELCYLDSKGCTVSNNGKVTVATTIDETLTVLISSKDSNKRVYLTFNYEIFGVVKDNIKILDREHDKPLDIKINEFKNKDRNEYSITENQFFDVYVSLEHELFIDKNLKYLMISNAEDDIVSVDSVSLWTKYKSIVIYRDLDSKTPFELYLKPYFDKYQFIYALILELTIKDGDGTKKVWHGYRLKTAFSELFKADLITNRVKALPIYYYNDMLSSWYDDEKYDDLLPSNLFYRGFAQSTDLFERINDTSVSPRINVRDQIVSVSQTSSENPMINAVKFTYDYVSKFDEETNSYTYSYTYAYPNTLEYVGYTLYYAMSNIIKKFGWDANDNNTDLMYSLLYLNKLIYDESLESKNDNFSVNVSVSDKNSAYRCLEADYTIANIDNIVSFWKSRVTAYERLLNILKTYDHKKSIVENIENYLNAIVINKQLKVNKVAKLLDIKYENRFGVRYSVAQYFNNRIWNATANEYFWTNLFHIMLSDTLSFRYINDVILQDFYRYGFCQTINVPEVDEDYRYVKYTFDIDEESGKAVPRALNKGKNGEYEVNTDETFEYLYNKEGYVVGIQKTNHKKFVPNFWKFYYTIEDNKNDFEVRVQEGDQEVLYSYDTIEGDESKSGILYYKGVRSYININQEIKPVPETLLDIEYLQTYGNYTINKKVVINKNGEINDNVFEIKRFIGLQKYSCVLSDSDFPYYWISADYNYLVKMHQKDMMKALEIQMYLNKLFASEMEKIANMIALYRKNKKLQSMQDSILAKEKEPMNRYKFASSIYDITNFELTQFSFLSDNVYSDDRYIQCSYNSSYEVFECGYFKYSKYYQDDRMINIPIAKSINNKVLSYSYNIFTRTIESKSLIPNNAKLSYVKEMMYYPNDELLEVSFGINDEKYKDTTYSLLISGRNANNNKPAKWSDGYIELNCIDSIDNYSTISNFIKYEDGLRNTTYTLMLNKFLDLNLDAINIAYNASTRTSDMTYVLISAPSDPDLDSINDIEPNAKIPTKVTVKLSNVCGPNDYINCIKEFTYGAGLKVAEDFEEKMITFDNYKYFTDGYVDVIVTSDYVRSVVKTAYLDSTDYFEYGLMTADPNNMSFTYQFFPLTSKYKYKDYSESYQAPVNTTYVTCVTYEIHNINNCERDIYDYYLGSASEWQLIQDNVKDINNFMAYHSDSNAWQPFYDGTLSYSSISQRIFWTSTQKNAAEAWPMFFTKQFVNFTPKYQHYYVRPFGKLLDKFSKYNLLFDQSFEEAPMQYKDFYMYNFMDIDNIVDTYGDYFVKLIFKDNTGYNFGNLSFHEIDIDEFIEVNGIKALFDGYNTIEYEYGEYIGNYANFGKTSSDINNNINNKNVQICSCTPDIMHNLDKLNINDYVSAEFSKKNEELPDKIYNNLKFVLVDGDSVIRNDDTLYSATGMGNPWSNTRYKCYVLSDKPNYKENDKLDINNIVPKDSSWTLVYVNITEKNNNVNYFKLFISYDKFKISKSEIKDDNYLIFKLRNIYDSETENGYVKYSGYMLTDNYNYDKYSSELFNAVDIMPDSSTFSIIFFNACIKQNIEGEHKVIGDVNYLWSFFRKDHIKELKILCDKVPVVTERPKEEEKEEPDVSYKYKQLWMINQSFRAPIFGDIYSSTIFGGYNLIDMSKEYAIRIMNPGVTSVMGASGNGQIFNEADIDSTDSTSRKCGFYKNRRLMTVDGSQFFEETGLNEMFEGIPEDRIKVFAIASNHTYTPNESISLENIIPDDSDASIIVIQVKVANSPSEESDNFQYVMYLNFRGNKFDQGGYPANVSFEIFEQIKETEGE